MVKCESGAWVRWQEMKGMFDDLEALQTRWKRLNASTRRLNLLNQWSAVVFSALFAAMFFVEGKLAPAVSCLLWTGAAVMWGRAAARNMPEEE